MPKTDNKNKDKEPVMLVRPAVKSLGLDYLHVSLIVLVIILIGLAFAISSFKPGPSATSCAYGLAANNTCIMPHHTASQALSSAEQVLASYATLNLSLNILPYYSYPNQSKISYLSNQSKWLVVIPYLDPLTNETYTFSVLLFDSNLTTAQTYLSSLNPPVTNQDKAVAFGAISLYGKSACDYKPPITVYAFIDPYAPGALQGMESGINAMQTFGSAVNISYKFVFTGYATSFYAGYGINATQQNGEDLWCASLQQSRFQAYLANYSLLFVGSPLGASQLYQVAQGSGLNLTQFNTCLAGSSQILNNQALFASYYSTEQTPSYIVNCQYQTIPETLNNAINYALNQIKG